MSLSIKNAETHALIRRLAELTGESMTTAITTAVRERLERLGPPEAEIRVRYAALLDISERAAPHMSADARNKDHGELLYDDKGLPRGD